nr:tryptophan--tRNA ligase [Desulfobacterales bacterium]
MVRKRILSGMRPTGNIHLGNLHGALMNWKELQEEYDCFFFVADWHAMTSDYDATDHIKDHIRGMVIDWLSVGLSPERSTIFVQSHIKEHAELFLILSMITPLAWLERNPTYKEQIAQLKNKDLSTFGFLGYPVLQAADIIMYKAHGVPVGVDQAPHVELTREIARRFNHFYGPIFPIPQTILTPTPRLLGIDGRKMSKSYNNAIYISETPDQIRAKVSQMVTDTKRARRSDPGEPNDCNVYSFHNLYTDKEAISRIEQECRKAEIGCVDCKELLAENLTRYLAPIYDKQNYYKNHPNLVTEIILEGCEKARSVAQHTMEEVRAAIKI